MPAAERHHTGAEVPRPLAGTRIVILGGSGFLGMSLAHELACTGADVVVVSRSPPKCTGPWRHVSWTARPLGPGRGAKADGAPAWASELDGSAALVNFAGRSVDCVKTPDRCDEILRSRVEATTAIGQAIRGVTSPPPIWVQMSTAHIYGDPPTEVCDESSSTGYGLAPTVGLAWEAAFRAALLPSQRGVVLRTSFVLGRDRGAGGGALATLRRLARLGLGGAVGAGRQGMSWIHEQDLNRVIQRAIAAPSMQGVYVVSSPNPLPQQEFMRALARRAGGLGALGLRLPAFEWMVRIGAPLVLRTDPELALYGRFVMPTRLLDEGFHFSFPRLEEALEELLRPR